METPSSVRRVTRSQTKTAINNIPMSRKNDRSALVDISNDSPIGGLAIGSTETPSSYFKKLEQSKKTPGSGEALLRYQVKNLLQKVEEEAELSKLNLENRPHLQVQGFVNSPSGFLAPTPANTPQVLNLSVKGDIDINLVDGFISETQSDKTQEMVIGETKEESNESPKNSIARLLFDFPDKSEASDSLSSSPCSSVLTSQETSSCEEKSVEEDDASLWSIQVNTSTKDDDEDEEGEIEEVEVEEDYEEEGDYEEEEGYGNEELDELCEGLSKINVQEKKMPEFAGKHTRFIYNNDDEIEGEQDILHLKGIPTPQGKLLRFAEEEEE